MSRVIWKYEISTNTSDVPLEMPAKSEVLPTLYRDSQGRLFIWAIVDPLLPKETRIFEIFGTGHSLGSLLSKKDYIATTVTPAGFVWHLFEVT